MLTDETCDILCNPRLFRRFGDALILNATILNATLVPDKAYTAAITKTATDDLIPLVADGGNLMGLNTCDHRITLVPGGILLIVDGKVVGAIGVGGGSKKQDLEIAIFVVDKFKKIATKQ